MTDRESTALIEFAVIAYRCYRSKDPTPYLDALDAAADELGEVLKIDEDWLSLLSPEPADLPS
jgi:hypothetical protein